jgi:hypothetical protein
MAWGCGPKDTPPDESSIQGTLEQVADGTIAGWAWVSNRPDEPIEVDIYDDNTLLATVRADQYREHLIPLGKGNGKHGFSYPVPGKLKDGNEHTIHVRASWTNIELVDSPKSLKSP